MRFPQPPRRVAALAGLALIVLTTFPAHATQALDAPTNSVRIMTMDEAIQLALTNDVDILISRQNPIIDQFALDGLFSVYDPTFGFSAVHSFNNIPAGINPADGSTVAFYDRSSDYTPSLSGELPFGTQYQLNGPINHNAGENVSADAAYSGSAGISLSQPLLRNLWIDTPRWNIAQARRTLRYDQLGLRLQVMTVVNNVKAAYYNLIYDRQNVDVEVAAVKLAQELVSENKKKVELGSLAPLDETQAQSQAASSEADLLAAQQTLAVQENTFKSLISLDLSEWNTVTPVPTEQLVAVPESLNVLECWRTALEMRPDIQQAKVNLEKQRITVKYDYNQLFPELDLQASYNHNGAGSSLDKDLGLVQKGVFRSYSYGAVLTVPLENTGAKANYKSAKASVQQQILQLKKVQNIVIIAVQDDVTIVQSDLLRVGATRAARIYAEDALTAEQTKLEHGKSTSFVVLQLQNNLTTARSAEIRALADYNIALEQLAFDEGVTLEQNKIQMPVH